MERRAGRVAVVGAGLAGLGAAWWLSKRGYAVVLFEARDRPGGRLASERWEGFTLEPASPLLSTADRELLGWIDEVGVADELLPLRPVLTAQLQRGRVREIRTRGLLGVARIPGIPAHGAARLLRLPRLLARYRPHLDRAAPERAAALDDRSVADFGRLYFGRQVLERWLAPAVTTTTLQDETETSRALFLHRHLDHDAARAGLPRAPLADLAQAAAAKLRVHNRSRVSRVEQTAQGPLRVMLHAEDRERRFEADAVVLAAPAWESARIAEQVLTPAERDVLGRVGSVASVSLAVALRRPFAPHPQLVRIPRSEGLPLEAILLEPGVPGGRVPGGAGLATLRATARWSEAHLGVPDEALEKELLDAFERAFPGARGAVEFTRVLRLPDAWPRFGVGHYRDLERLARVERDERRRGRRVYLAGDYRAEPSWNGALRSAQRAARALAEDLG
jgi:oxygen-dependent protoporphyrinogen oxidase